MQAGLFGGVSKDMLLEAIIAELRAMKTRSAFENGGDSPRLPQSNSSPIVLWRAPPLSFLLARDDDGANVPQPEHGFRKRPGWVPRNALK